MKFTDMEQKVIRDTLVLLADSGDVEEAENVDACVDVVIESLDANVKIKRRRQIVNHVESRLNRTT